MIDWLRRRPLAISLLGACAAFLVVIAAELQFGSHLAALAPSGKRAVPTEAKLLPPIVAVAPEQAYRETAARPLFTPTRRPAPEPASAAQNTFVKGQFVLQGVTIVGDTRIALLREKSNGKIHRVERGRDVNGITVAEVQPETVTLAQGGDSEVLPLTVQKAAGSASPVQLGPFGHGAAGAPGIAVAQPPPQPAVSMPIPGQAPGAPVAPAPPAVAPAPRTTFDFGPLPPGVSNQLPQGQTPYQATQATQEAPLSPEELLARRRARRSQQTP